MASNKEKRIANKILELVSDVTLDLEAVGEYIGNDLPQVRHKRLDVVVDRANFEREQINERRRRGYIV